MKQDILNKLDILQSYNYFLCDLIKKAKNTDDIYESIITDIEDILEIKFEITKKLLFNTED